MKFKDKSHEESYCEVLRLMDDYDVYHEVFAYLITLDVVCRKHVCDLYDFEERCLKLNPLDHCWQTSTSRKTTALAYNLYTGVTLWCEEEDASCCSVAEVMNCSYGPYYWEAIRFFYFYC